MPAEIQTGTATVFGVTNDGTAISIAGYATFLLQSASPTHKFDLKEIKDNNNADANLIASNSMVEMDVDFMPSGATRAAAAAVAVFLTPLSSVVIAHCKVAALNGTWIYVGSEKMEVTHDDSVKMTLPLRKYDDATQNTSLATVVTG